jgi:hypothetical protein
MPASSRAPVHILSIIVNKVLRNAKPKASISISFTPVRDIGRKGIWMKKD